MWHLPPFYFNSKSPLSNVLSLKKITQSDKKHYFYFLWTMWPELKKRKSETDFLDFLFCKIMLISCRQYVFLIVLILLCVVAESKYILVKLDTTPEPGRNKQGPANPKQIIRRSVKPVNPYKVSDMNTLVDS